MSYPIKDKTKAERIRKDFEKEIDDIATNKKTYEDEIAKLRKKPIPQTLKNKLIDPRFGKEHAFEGIKHSHSDRSRLNMINCARCQYDQREIECENLIDSLNGNEEMVIKKQGQPDKDVTLSKLKIVRGRFDDFVGFQWEWL